MESVSVAPTSILDLSAEVWFSILGYLTLSSPVDKGQLDWAYAFDPRSQDLPTLQNLRLVCRRTRELVDPMMCHVSRFSLDSRSVARIESMSSNASVLQNMYGIELDLSLRLHRSASSLKSYAIFARQLVRDASAACLPDEDETAADGQEMNRSDPYQEAIEVYKEIESAWSTVVDHPDRFQSESRRSNATSGSESYYQDMLLDNFVAYSRLYEYQREIVLNGSFVRGLARAISQCKRRLFVSFVDCLTTPSPGSPTHSCKLNAARTSLRMSREKALETANNLSHLGRRLQASSSLIAVEAYDPDMNAALLPARILTELPIACNELGASLVGLSIGVFPQLNNYASLMAPSERLEDLASACRNLETVQFGKRGLEEIGNFRPADEENRRLIDNYLGSICSGQKLELLHLHLSVVKALDRAHRLGHRPYCISNVLSMRGSSQLTQVVLSELGVTSAALEQFFAGIRSPRHISLSNVTLETGMWARTMEILHDKVAQSTCKEKCSVSLTQLHGGEFKHQLDAYNGGWIGGYGAGVSPRLPLLERVLAYILDDGETVNPLQVRRLWI